MYGSSQRDLRPPVFPARTARIHMAEVILPAQSDADSSGGVGVLSTSQSRSIVVYRSRSGPTLTVKLISMDIYLPMSLSLSSGTALQRLMRAS